MSDVTNYNKDEMENLKNEITRCKTEYSSLIDSLAANISDIHNYWVEGDVGAEAVYNSLQSQFNQFKKSLIEGTELMTNFENQVSKQIGKYEEAEIKTNKEVSW